MLFSPSEIIERRAVGQSAALQENSSWIALLFILEEHKRFFPERDAQHLFDVRRQCPPLFIWWGKFLKIYFFFYYYFSFLLHSAWGLIQHRRDSEAQTGWGVAWGACPCSSLHFYADTSCCFYFLTTHKIQQWSCAAQQQKWILKWNRVTCNSNCLEIQKKSWMFFFCVWIRNNDIHGGIMADPCSKYCCKHNKSRDKDL